MEFLPQNMQITITDRGIGIAPEDLQQLFEPFHRGQNVRRIPGTGLGLIVVKKCVDLHRGEIYLDSQLNQGTRAVVTIPLE